MSGVSENEPLIVTVRGTNGTIDEQALAAQLLPAYHHPNVIVDLSDIVHLETMALGQFVRKRQARAAHGWDPSRLVLTSPVQHLFQNVGFDRIWPIFPTLNKARWDATG